MELRALVQGMIDRFIRFLVMLIYKITSGLCRLLYKLKISGGEHIPATGPCILVCNHSSKMDILLLILKQTRPDANLFGSGVRVRAAPLGRALGGIPMFKGMGHSGPFLWMALKALQHGRSIMIAPEGEMEWDGRIRQLKPGVAWLALRSWAPVVACVLRGGYSIWPRWARFPRLTGRLEIRIGKPLSIPEASHGKVDREMIQTVSRRIADEMRRLVEEP